RCRRPPRRRDGSHSGGNAADARSDCDSRASMSVDASAIVGRALVDPAGWTVASAGVDAASLIEAAVRHRILLMLGWTLRAAGRLHDSPPPFVETFQRAERAAVVEDVVRHTELVQVLE